MELHMTWLTGLAVRELLESVEFVGMCEALLLIVLLGIGACMMSVPTVSRCYVVFVLTFTKSSQFFSVCRHVHSPLFVTLIQQN